MGPPHWQIRAAKKPGLLNVTPEREFHMINDNYHRIVRADSLTAARQAYREFVAK